MSEQSQGPGWWLASDGKWYPPETHPSVAVPPPTRAPSGRLGIYLVLAVVSVLLLGAVTLFLVITQDGSDGFSPFTERDERSEADDGDLDRLHDDCDDGDMEACDELYFESPIGSDEEEFGSTCGGRRGETEGDCA